VIWKQQQLLPPHAHINLDRQNKSRNTFSDNWLCSVAMLKSKFLASLAMSSRNWLTKFRALSRIWARSSGQKSTTDVMKCPHTKG